ncbi:MAG: hypothetical protein KJ921_15655 [Proteobacteria bacterium]|nr:hypothetical protein [Pseudomonadota bacterium]
MVTEYNPRTKENTNYSQPTRQFRFIFDPSVATNLSSPSIGKIDKLFLDIELVNAAVEIEVWVPNQLLKDRVFVTHPLYSEWVQVVSCDKNVKLFKFHKNVDDFIEWDSLSPDESATARYLLGISEFCQADGIVTNNKLLVEYRYQIYQYHRQRIIPLDEFADIMEIILHGNSIFLSATDSCLIYDNDTFYQSCHWKASRYSNWFQKISVEIKSKKLFDNLHSALLNRYPYIVYSRDMVKYYEFQQDYFYRSGIRQSYGLTLGYYLNYFYLLLWGMMDSMTLIAKLKLNLQASDRVCSISKSRSTKKYWQLIEDRLPALFNFVSKEKVQEWITVMADMRHHAAHKPIKRASLILNEGSKIQTDDEIRSEIRRENAYLYEKFPQKMKALEEIELQNRKIDQYEILAPRGTQINLPNGKVVMRDFVSSIDYDLERLNSIIDAFLVALFNKEY